MEVCFHFSMEALLIYNWKSLEAPRSSWRWNSCSMICFNAVHLPHPTRARETESLPARRHSQVLSFIRLETSFIHQYTCSLSRHVEKNWTMAGANAVSGPTRKRLADREFDLAAWTSFQPRANVPRGFPCGDGRKHTVVSPESEYRWSTLRQTKSSGGKGKRIHPWCFGRRAHKFLFDTTLSFLVASTILSLENTPWTYMQMVDRSRTNLTCLCVTEVGADFV